MKKLLFISNITRKITSVASTSILASKEMGIEFVHAANWGNAVEGQVQSDEQQYGIKIYNVDLSRSPYSFSNIKAYKQMCKLIRENKIDYIHCNTPVGGVLGRLAGKRCKVEKIIYQPHGFHFYKGAPKKNWIIYYSIEKLLARFTDCIITINSEDYAAAKKFNLKKNGKIYKVNGVGIDLQEFEGIAKYRDIKRKELSFDEEDIVIISVGELNTNKNNKVIINALSQMKDSHIHYILCGIGEEKENLQELVKKSNLEKNVHFLGYRSDMKELYAASDIFVMPSFREGLSRSIMEAMASGLPCIVSRIRGNIDLVEEGKGGFLCEPHDIAAFVNAIKSCTEKRRKQFKQHNLEAIKQYDIHTVENEIKKIYEEVFQ